MNIFGINIGGGSQPKDDGHVRTPQAPPVPDLFPQPLGQGQPRFGPYNPLNLSSAYQSPGTPGMFPASPGGAMPASLQTQTGAPIQGSADGAGLYQVGQSLFGGGSGGANAGDRLHNYLRQLFNPGDPYGVGAMNDAAGLVGPDNTNIQDEFR